MMLLTSVNDRITMSFLRNFWKDSCTLGRLAKVKLSTPKFGECKSIPLLVQKNAMKYPDDSAISCDLEQLNWGEFNQRANRVANLLKSQGIKKGDTIALMMENRCEYLVCLVGICKLGAIAGLLNTHQRREVLAHSLELIQAKKLIFGEELAEAVDELRSSHKGLYFEIDDLVMITDRQQQHDTDWAMRFSSSQISSYSDLQNPAECEELTTSDTALYIFTSGTTGLPKAGIASHRRWLQASGGFAMGLYNTRKQDRIYNCLPLFHATALMVAFGPTVVAACSMVLRRRFSASNFLADVRREHCNTFIYIGEMCRYLVNTPATESDKDNPINKCAGNGMRPDIWNAFRDRFDIPEIFEFYGASDGNTVFINSFNKDSSIGFCISPIVVAQYDANNDTIARNQQGLCIAASNGEPGLLLGEISQYTPYEGYTNKQASDLRVVKDVKKPGDQYLNMGDLIQSMDVGFTFGLRHYQFVDRTGDSFRWKGENCSTNEIAETINQLPMVDISNVYGVEIPNTNGKAGMAAICFNAQLISSIENINWEEFSAYIDRELPGFARPIFIRVQTEADTTGTHKLLKNHLKEAAFHLERVKQDKIYILKPGSKTYEELGEEFYQRIVEGRAGY